MLTDKKKIKELERQIRKLTKENALQKSMIELLRVLPGNMHIKLGIPKKGKKKNDISKRTQGTSGGGNEDRGSRQSKDSGASSESDLKNTAQLEEESQAL